MDPMLKFTLGLLFLFITSCNSKYSDRSDKSVDFVVNSKNIELIDRTLKEFVDQGDVAGISALVYEKNTEVYFNAFGYADIESDVPMSRNTIVQIYSMTKPITGVALMQLYEQGKFRLDDPLHVYAPEYKDTPVLKEVDDDGNVVLEKAARPISIRDITRHTAGFANDVNMPGIGPLLSEADPRNRNNTVIELSQKLAQVPLIFQPGSQWYYGLSVDVQASLVERLSGEPFDEYLKKNIFEPLGMTETGFYVPTEKQNRFAATYRRSDDGQLFRVPDSTAHSFNTHHWNLKPGGWGIASTIDDYMNFARMLVNEGTFKDKKILQAETVKLMATNHLADSITERLWLPSKGNVGFGIDFAVRENPPTSSEENYGVVGEFFWDGAASTLFWVDPENDITAVLFVQLFPYDQIGLHKKFRKAVYGIEN